MRKIYFLPCLIFMLFMLGGCEKDVKKLPPTPDESVVHEKKSDPVEQKRNTQKESSKQKCTEDQRKGDFCIEIYKPVCGWFGEKIACITYPCAGDFSNSCFACQDENVDYWTDGQCPKPGEYPK